MKQHQRPTEHQVLEAYPKGTIFDFPGKNSRLTARKRVLCWEREGKSWRLCWEYADPLRPRHFQGNCSIQYFIAKMFP